MAISSLGVGSSILTQDVLDQLRAADDAGRITPIVYKLENVKDKQKALELVDSNMTNFVDSTNAVSSAELWDERLATVNSGTSVSVSADSSTDVQDFTLYVDVLATKQIEESGAFSSNTELIATAAGTMNINIDSQDFTIDYDETTTLDDLKDLINATAGDKVDATVVQIKTGEYRLFVSSADTGTSEDITMTDDSGFLAGTSLTTSMTVVQTAVDAEFTFNGQAITRTSNTVDDLITGLTISLEEIGSSDVSIAQDRTSILKKFDSFVNKYNTIIVELDKLTASSTEASARGVFSSDSTIKNMQRTIESMISTVGEGVGSMYDYGFDVDKDGKMTLDKDVLEAAMDDDLTNVQSFFSGGDYTDPTDASVTTLTGAFAEISTILEGYTESDAILDLVADAFTGSISELTDRKASATERLDAKYSIMKKQWGAYDLMISRFKSASSMFTQMANAQYAAGNQ